MMSLRGKGREVGMERWERDVGMEKWERDVGKTEVREKGKEREGEKRGAVEGNGMVRKGKGMGIRNGWEKQRGK